MSATTEYPPEVAPLAAKLAGSHGTVLIREHYWTGGHVGVSGDITVTTAENALGFPVTNRDSNWLVTVEGETDTVVLPGCAVLAFHYHKTDPPESEQYYKVP